MSFKGFITFEEVIYYIQRAQSFPQNVVMVINIQNVIQIKQR